MAASGGGLSPPANVAGLNIQTMAKARFPGRPSAARSRLRAEKRTKRGRLGSDDGEQAVAGPRPVNIGLAFSEDPCLLRLLGVTEKHGRQKDAGFISSNSEGEEDFSGFGTTTFPHSPLRQSQSPQSADISPGSKPILGKIVQKTSKPAVVGKIVPRSRKDSGTEAIKQEVGLDSGSSTKSAASIRNSGNMQNQMAITSTGRKPKIIPGVRRKDQYSKFKESDETTDEETDTDQQSPDARKRGVLPIHKRKGRRECKDLGAEDDKHEGEKDVKGPHHLALLKRKKSRSKMFSRPPKRVQKATSAPVERRPRPKNKFFTYELVPIKTDSTPQLNPGQAEASSNSSTSLTASGRSSRIIKIPKRFLEEEITPTRKRAYKIDTKLGFEENVMPEFSNSQSGLECPSSHVKSPAKQSTGSSQDIYKNLKKLTLKLAERKKSVSETEGESFADGEGSTKKKRKRRSKIKMEEMDSPGAIRKLAVSVDASVGGATGEVMVKEEVPAMEVAHTIEGTEVSGVGHRFGLSGANKRMLQRMLRKAKVQLIKIDQQKQLKITQSLMAAGGRRRRRKHGPHSKEYGPQVNYDLQPLAGPRIKHVCRAAAVALGQPRAMVPDDIPRLSALPLHEREGISFTPTTEGTEWQPPSYQSVQPQYIPGGSRSRRCGECDGCLVETDCAKCAMCLDKPKFGGFNIKKQCCMCVFKSKEYVARVACSLVSGEDKKKSLRNVKRRSFSSLLSDEDDPGNEENKCKATNKTRNQATCLEICLLCASQGQHEMLYCQICCEPFHSFCLLPEERPQEENKENWCCRRCKFCHVCGRKSKSSKPVLQCRRCQTSYHPSCLGPTYPKPLNCDVCMTCIRCQSCGVTRGKTWDLAWNQKQDLCPDCTALYEKGNFCTICQKCYEDNSQHEQIQCSKCNRWIHAKCEGISEELFELFSSLAEEMPFTCSPCNAPEGSNLKGALQSRLTAQLQEVLTDLLSSSTTQHLLICKRCYESQPSEYSRGHSVCDLQAVEKKFKSALYDSVKTFHADVASVLRKWQKEEEILPEDQRRTNSAKDHYVKLMERIFVWFPHSHLKNWTPFSEEFPSGMLPEAVLPPSKEHSYAQWMERSYQQRYNKTKDGRQCMLCQQSGDASPSDQGRLLYMGQNEWAHINCCLWSAEVYEDNGALLQVHSAVSRGRHLRCDRCGQSGATVGCCLMSCQSNFHFMCARIENCIFQHDRKVYCNRHRELISDKVNRANEFEVPRRVYVDFHGINLKRKFLTGLEPESINMSIGSLQIHKLGVLTELSSNGRALYPVGYQCSRLYWSTVDPRRRCKYTCKVTEVSTPLPGEEQDTKFDQGENHTIIHSPNLESMECESYPVSPLKSNTPSPKMHNTSGSKSPIYPHARRPAGGSSRPLPFPGTAPPKPHHIVTLRDLEDTRRTRRLSSRSRCSSSPSDTDLSAPVTHRSGGTRTSLFSSPPRSAVIGPLSPPLSRQNSTSPVWGSPTTSGFSPHRGSLNNSPKGRHSFKITTPVSAEVPQDFLASSEAEDAAVATTNGISLAPDNLVEEVAQLMSQELPYTVFDTDVAVDSMLNAKLEFDDNLLSENMAFSCQTNKGESEDSSFDKTKQENEAEDEDSKHYIKFSRTVVDVPSSSDTPNLNPAQSIMQLDGADGESDSDDSEIMDKETQSSAIKQLESIYSGSQSTSNQQPLMPSSVLDNNVLLDAETGHFTSASVVLPKNNADDDDNSSSSSDESVEGFKDDLKDPDYAPELPSPKKLQPPVKPITVKQATPTPPPRKINLVMSQPHKVRLVLPSPTVGSSPGVAKVATIGTVPRTVTSPIVINGLNALPVQPGAPRGRSIAIRLNNTKPVGQQQTAPQVLLVNRQGQILIKDPRTNTYQAVSTNSPAYNKISQIAKLLHSGNPLQRNLPRVVIRPQTATAMPSTTSETSTSNQAIAASITTPTTPVSSPPEEEDTAQDIIEKAMATHREVERTKPIIIRKGGRKPKSKPDPLVQTMPLALIAIPQTSSRAQVRIKRVSSLSERPNRKKSKLDYLVDASEPEEAIDSKSSGVRMKAPSLKDVLDLDEEHKLEHDPLRIVAPPAPKYPRADVAPGDCDDDSKTHKWVSSRHGDLTDWGPYSGVSSEDEPPTLKFRKKTCMNQPHLRFEITSDDGFSVKANSIEVAWRAVIDGVLEARADFHLKQLPLGGMNGPRVLGLLHDAVLFLLEQLQGAADCKQHRFRFHRCENQEEELPLNPSGCARAEVCTRYYTW
uniref:[histone H3]-lysine(4) N-methyltransferase n=1 Tax=Periophthalmus magnuspinnatus TaxID=409849 RepID=A0A3B3ZC32_9GOBI